MNIIGKRKLWFGISIAIIIPGLIALALWGLNLGIDFRGGQSIEIEGGITQSAATQLIEQAGGRSITATTTGDGKVLVRYNSGDEKQAEEVRKKVETELAKQNFKETSFESIGPSVSRDIARNALIAIVLASLAIVIYIAFAFRNAPPPVSPWSFGICAIIAMLHDALFVLGIFAILGHFADVEVDSLFITAILTVIGFSVHDTIVVFDRVRENLKRYNQPFEETVNTSIIETFVRSINTSITVVITLLALYLFGGESIKYFVLALLLGIISGTYSSIFNAAPLLVVWNNYKINRAKPTKKS